MFNLNFVFRLSYAKHKYFDIIPWYSNFLANLLMLVHLIIEACMMYYIIRKSG